MVIYNGRPVKKDGFRAFIYSPKGFRKIAESWDEFQRDVSSGVWFATKEQAEKLMEERPKKKRGE